MIWRDDIPELEPGEQVTNLQTRIRDRDCEHVQKGRAWAQVIADMASEREAYRLTGNHEVAREIEDDAATVKLWMQENYREHEAVCA